MFPDLLLNLFRRSRGCNQFDPLWGLPGKREIAFPHPLPETKPFLFQAVFPRTSLERQSRLKIEKNCQKTAQTLEDKAVNEPQKLEVETTAVTLISDTGINKTIAQDYLSCSQCRKNCLPYKLGPRPSIEKGLGNRTHPFESRIEEELANSLGKRGPSWLSGNQNGITPFLKLFSG